MRFPDSDITNEGDTEEGRYRMWVEGRSEVNLPPPEWIERKNRERSAFADEQRRWVRTPEHDEAFRAELARIIEEARS